VSIPHLVYDVGLHRGEDTEYYLKKGFGVIDSKPIRNLCGIAGQRSLQKLLAVNS
jgi:hypothetical protein